jgi:hypothetical protein
LNLARVGAAGDDEKVGERGDVAQVQNGDVFGLFRRSGFCGGVPELLGGDRCGFLCQTQETVLLPVSYYN